MIRPIYRILIIDDSAEDARIYTNLLTGADEFEARISLAQTAAEGTERVENFTYDCILLDYQLPDADGLKLLGRLMARFENLAPVVMITGRGDEALAVSAMRAGAADYVVKAHINEENLSRAVRGAVAQAQSARDLADERRKLEIEQRTRMEAQEHQISLLQKLRAERSRFARILAQIPSPIAILSGLGQTVEFSNAAMDSLLRDRGHTGLTRLHDGLGPEVGELARLVFIAGRRYEAFEFELGEPGDGPSYHLVLEPQFDEAGQVTGILLVMNDVSPIVQARRRAEASESLARESEGRFRRIAEVFPHGICVFDASGRLEYVNSSFSDYTGWTLANFRSNSWRKSIHAGDRRRVRDLWAEAVDGVKTLAVAFRIKNTAGTYRWHSARVTPLLDEDGLILKWYVSLIDTHDERLLTQSLSDSEQRLKTATRSSSVGVWEVRLQDRQIWSNEQFRSIMGLGPSDQPITLESILENVLFEDRPRFDFEMRRAIDHEEAIEGEFRILWKDQTLHWIRLRAAFDVSSAGLRRLLGTVIDISEHKQREQDLQDARNAAMQANASKTSFLANMSHEIRTPLCAIMGFTEILGYDDLSSDDRRQYSGTIHRNAETLMQIIDDILDLSKMEAGKLAVVVEDVSLRRILGDLEQAFGSMAAAKNVDFEIRINEEVPDVISADPIRLRQILNNALSNAIKFTAAGKVEMRVARCGPAGQVKSLCFTVTDTGIGISEEDQRTLFQPFTQADATLTRRFGGTGLGLMLSRRLARLMGGAFFLARSAPGQGSTFELRLPTENLDREMVPAGDLGLPGSFS